MKIKHSMRLIVVALLCGSLVAVAQEDNKMQSAKDKKDENTMKTYVIEREIPGAGKLTNEELKAISKGSCSVLEEMDEAIEWVHSYVTGDKVFCIYRASNEMLIREHGKRGGFPVNAIHEIATVISPKTAEN